MWTDLPKEVTPSIVWCKSIWFSKVRDVHPHFSRRRRLFSWRINRLSGATTRSCERWHWLRYYHIIYSKDGTENGVIILPCVAKVGTDDGTTISFETIHSVHWCSIILDWFMHMVHWSLSIYLAHCCVCCAISGVCVVEYVINVWLLRRTILGLEEAYVHTSNQIKVLGHKSLNRRINESFLQAITKSVSKQVSGVLK